MDGLEVGQEHLFLWGDIWVLGTITYIRDGVIGWV